MSLLGGHLGARTSALLDGQLDPVEAERAWLHVRDCATCHGLVERELWLKRRLAGLREEVAAPGVPSGLKGDLLSGAGLAAPAEPEAAAESSGRTRRILGIAAFGGGAVGAAFVGVMTLGAAPADAPAAPTRYAPPSVPAVYVVRATHR